MFELPPPRKVAFYQSPVPPMSLRQVHLLRLSHLVHDGHLRSQQQKITDAWMDVPGQEVRIKGL